jgi:hypothetical protein
MDHESESKLLVEQMNKALMRWNDSNPVLGSGQIKEAEFKSKIKKRGKGSTERRRILSTGFAGAPFYAKMGGLIDQTAFFVGHRFISISQAFQMDIGASSDHLTRSGGLFLSPF